jgi:hypothetical protein
MKSIGSEIIERMNGKHKKGLEKDGAVWLSPPVRKMCIGISLLLPAY